MAANVRPATDADFELTVQLRAAVGGALTGSSIGPDETSWHDNAREFFVHARSADTLNAYVAERDGSVVAVGIAVILQIMPAEWLPNGKLGYLHWFATDPGWRRHGFAAAIAQHLMAWLRSQGVQRAQLHSTEAGVALYDNLGFEPTKYPNFWIVL